MKKGRNVMIISIGAIALILTMVIFIQFKTVKETDITAIETMREAELRTELSSWKAKYDEISAKLEETEDKISNYRNDIENNEKNSKLLDQEYADTEKYLGYTDVQGEGIQVVLDDTEYKQVQSSDILSLVNELRLAGAEAISINDERVVSTTEIVNVDTRFVIVNGKRVVAPFTIKAIGDKKYLESAISIKGGYIDEIKAKEITINYSVEDKLTINKFSGKMSLQNAKEK
jgi:uncharacterized protein YlxW (UPF0749 family)